MQKCKIGARRILSLFLAVMMLIACCPAVFSAGAAGQLSSDSLRVNYYESNPPYLNVDSALKDHMVSVTWLDFTRLAKDEKGAVKDYMISVQPPEGENAEVTENKVIGAYGSTVAWRLDDPKAGNYRITVQKRGEPENQASLTLQLKDVRFHTDTGTFQGDAGTEYATVAQANAELRYIPIPAVVPPEEKDFLGWSDTQGQTLYTAVTTTVPQEGGDLYAVYGTKKTWQAEIQDKATGEKVEKLDFGALEYEAEPTSRELVIKNTGTETLEDVGVFNTLQYFDVTFTAPQENKLNPGATADLTITPKAKLAAGEYQETLIAGRRSGLIFLDVSVSVGKTKTVTVTPSATTKGYGEELNSQTIKATVDDGSVSYDELGITWESDGFPSTAKVGEYDLRIASVSNPHYHVELSEQAGKLTVEKATPKGTPNASAVKKGDNLEKSVLTGTFVNPNNDSPVAGTLAWKETAVVPDTGNYTWVFTPEDLDNYTILEGTAEVLATDKIETRIIPTKGDSGNTTFTFTYDGQQHGVDLTTNRPGNVEGSEVEVQYAKEGTEDYSTDLPIDAGTYLIKATVAETAEYAGAAFSGTLIIEKKTLSIFLSQVRDKAYDGTNKAEMVYAITTKVDGDDVDVSYNAHFADSNVGQGIAVTINLTGITGTDADNYKLGIVTYHRTANITPREITIQGTATKFYGEERDTQQLLASFSANMPEGQTIQDLRAQFTSEGMAASAPVVEGGYEVTATIENPNYILTEATIGRLEVQKTTPVLRDGSLEAGRGRKGGALDNVSLNGEFYNPYSHEDVTGTFAWKESGKTLPDADTTTEEWTFTMDTEFEANYEPPAGGSVVITLVDKEPMVVEVQDVTVHYDGKAHPFESYKVRYPDGAPADALWDVNILYRGDGQDEWVKDDPVDAGIYTVQITGVSKLDAYADNVMTATLTIEQATPTVPEVPDLPVVEGTKVDDLDDLLISLLLRPTGIDGAELDGTYIWDASGSVVSKDGETYHYTFVPSNPNYHDVTGSVTVRLVEPPVDERVLQAVIYNLPNAEGYTDYAVLDVAENALEAGDIVTFYKEEACTTPESEPLTISETDITNGSVKILLDGDALEVAGGTIYAKIDNTHENAPSAVTYLPELDMVLTPADITLTDDAPELTVTVGPSHESYEITSVTFHLQGNDYVLQKGTTDRGITLFAMAPGTTTLTVTVTFTNPDPNHEDQTIEVTKTVDVVSDLTKPHEHKMTVHEGTPADCENPGTRTYYVCEECGQMFFDEEGTQPFTDLADTVIPALGHDLEHVEAKEPTMEEDGNIEYWHCKRCGKYFSDANAENEITEEETVLKRYPLGDVNKDHTLDIADALEMFAFVDGEKAPTAEDIAWCDINKDGKLNLFDVYIVYQLVSGAPLA